MTGEATTLLILAVAILFIGAAVVSNIGTVPQSKAFSKLASNKLMNQLKWYAVEMSVRLELGSKVNEKAMRAALVEIATFDYARQPEMQAFVAGELAQNIKLMKRSYNSKN